MMKSLQTGNTYKHKFWVTIISQNYSLETYFLFNLQFVITVIISTRLTFIHATGTRYEVVVDLTH